MQKHHLVYFFEVTINCYTSLRHIFFPRLDQIVVTANDFNKNKYSVNI